MSKRVIIDCPYSVHDYEWDNFIKMLEGLISGSDYSNFNIRLEELNE